MKKPFDHVVLLHLAKNAGFTSTGNPKAAAHFLYKLLSLTPLYENRQALEQLLPTSGLQCLVLNFVDQLGLLEHGGGIGGSWATDAGKTMLQTLSQIDWDEAAADCGSVAQLVSPAGRTSQSRLPYWQIFDELGFCNCGQPWALLALAHQILRDLDAGGDLCQLLPDPGVRQFLLYQLRFRGLVSSDGKLTELAGSIAARLDLVEQDKYEEPELE